MTLFTPAGRLIHTVTVEVITGKSQSATNLTTPIWTAADELPAEVKPLHGRNIEIAQARTKGKSVSHQITMRHSPLVREVQSRINFEGRIFEVFSVVNVLEQNIELDVLANEIRA